TIGSENTMRISLASASDATSPSGAVLTTVSPESDVRSCRASADGTRRHNTARTKAKAMRFMCGSPEAGRLGEHLSLWGIRHRIEADGGLAQGVGRGLQTPAPIDCLAITQAPISSTAPPAGSPVSFPDRCARPCRASRAPPRYRRLRLPARQFLLPS